MEYNVDSTPAKLRSSDMLKCGGGLFFLFSSRAFRGRVLFKEKGRGDRGRISGLASGRGGRR